MTGNNFAQVILLALFAASLVCGAVMDIRFKRVKRWIWLWGGGAALLLFWVRRGGGPEKDMSIAVQIVGFILLQFFLFDGMYGRADCFAFSCCSILLGALGGGIRDFLLHMLFSIVFLGMVQICKGNVNRQGNLKEPVAFIPYIAAALPLALLCLNLYGG